MNNHYRCIQCNGHRFEISQFGFISCPECHLGGYLTYDDSGAILVGEEE